MGSLIDSSIFIAARTGSVEDDGVHAVLATEVLDQRGIKLHGAHSIAQVSIACAAGKHRNFRPCPNRLPCSKFHENKEATMRPIKSIKDLPLFPLIPLVPVALFLGSVVTAITALVRVRRLERRITSPAH